jgi:hypothetical protein
MWTTTETRIYSTVHISNSTLANARLDADSLDRPCCFACNPQKGPLFFFIELEFSVSVENLQVGSAFALLNCDFGASTMKAKAQPIRHREGITLGRDLKVLTRQSVEMFQDVAKEKGFQIDNVSAKKPKHYIEMLQFCAVQATVREFAYTTDIPTFLEIVYAVLTDNLPHELQGDIESLSFPSAGSGSLSMWADMMASEISQSKDNSQLIAELLKFATFTVAQTKLATCLMFKDEKEAEKVRRVHFKQS